MENYLYQCQYCGKEYKPNRRHKQIFCSNSCRTNSHIRNKKLKLAINTHMPETPKPNQIEKMSWAGFGNALAGTIVANKVTTLLTSEENKPLTQKYFADYMKTQNGRYFPIKNGPKNSNGAIPYYDILTQTFLYLPNQKK